MKTGKGATSPWALRYVTNRTTIHSVYKFALVSHSMLGLYSFTYLQLFEVGEVLGSRGNTKAKKLRNGGTLFARITAAPVEDLGTLHLNLRGINLKNVDGVFGKSDPFFEISAKVNAAGGLTWHPVYRSQHILNDLNPKWPDFTVEVARLCDNGDLNKPVLVEVWDWDKKGKHTNMGKFETSVNGLLAARVSGGDGPARSVDASKGFSLIKKGKEFGKIVVTTARLEGFSAASAQAAATASSSILPQSAPPAAMDAAMDSSSLPSFSEALDRPPPSFQTTAAYVSAAAAISNHNLSKPAIAPVPYVPVALPPPSFAPTTKMVRPKFVDYLSGGCELELTIAIDFTGSNGDPRRPGTLHYIHPDGQLNDYEKAITAVGGVIARYDSDQKFPVFGFGAKYGGVIQHCFQVGGKEELDGLSGVLEAYRGVFRTGLTMSGPTVFAEVIDFAAATARSKQEASKRIGQQSYKILLILTDGAVTDIEQTKRAIHAASDAPLSIVIVGIGNADFSAMQELDDFEFIGSGGRDIVQFVQFSHHANDRSSLTRATLEEIPDQLVDYFSSRGIKPLPPMSGSQISLQAEDPTDEDIDLSMDVSPEGEISLANYDGAVFDDTKYGTISDYSALTPVPVPSAPYQPSAPFVPPSNAYGQQQPNAYAYGQQQSNAYGRQQPAAFQSYGQQPVAQAVQPTVFHVQVPPNVTPGMQLQIKHPATQQPMIVTVPPGVAPGGTFAVRY
jgi:Copine/C2 domain